MAYLREKLKKEEMEGVCVYFVSLPMESMHTHKLIGATRRMSPKIRENSRVWGSRYNKCEGY